jgi:hypothetical protein
LVRFCIIRELEWILDGDAEKDRSIEHLLVQHARGVFTR